MAKASKIERVVAYTLMAIARPLRNRWATAIYVYFLRRWGVRFTGGPAYISSKVDLDGTDYALFTIGEGVTISSYVRLLTHDWAPFTISKAMKIETKEPLGRVMAIAIGDYSFIGTGSIIMPGAKIGRGCLIGAGTVVRGTIPDYSILIGSPGQRVGDTRDYMARHFKEHAAAVEASRVAE